MFLKREGFLLAAGIFNYFLSPVLSVQCFACELVTVWFFTTLCIDMFLFVLIH